MKCFFMLLLCLSVQRTAAAAGPAIVVDLGGVPVRLEKFNNDFINQTFWGEYVTSIHAPQEFHYHFFPDKKFFVTAACDLCTEVPIAEGFFRFSKAQILLTYVGAKGRDIPPGPLFALHGFNNPRDGAERRYEIIILDKKNYLKAMAGGPSFEFIRRREAYLDWQAIYSRLRQNRKTHGANVTPDGYPKLRPPK